MCPPPWPRPATRRGHFYLGERGHLDLGATGELSAKVPSVNYHLGAPPFAVPGGAPRPPAGRPRAGAPSICRTPCASWETARVRSRCPWIPAATETGPASSRRPSPARRSSARTAPVFPAAAATTSARRPACAHPAAAEKRWEPGTNPEQCASGFCVEGFCCDQKCDSPCESCALPFSRGTCQLREGGGPAGAGGAADGGGN